MLASQALGASEPAPWRPQVYMTLTFKHTQNSNPQGPRIAKWTHSLEHEEMWPRQNKPILNILP